MSSMDVNQVLAQMRAMQASAAGKALSANTASAEQIQATGRADFSQVMQQTVDKVNANQAASSALQTAYVAGSDQVDLPEVMMAVQEASISFQAVTQVRNRLLSAYQDVMNMPL